VLPLVATNRPDWPLIRHLLFQEKVMSSIFGRCVGLNDGEPLHPDVATRIVERRSRLSHVEARVAVLDYFGERRGQISEQLEVSTETVRTYWKRIYAKTHQRGRDAVRLWVERILRAEIEGENAT
jgi:DNA-binding CsgD family transcriptional regulator